MSAPRRRLDPARVVARGPRVVLVTPHEDDGPELLALRRASWEFLRPWEPDLPGIDPLGPAWLARYLRIGPRHGRERWLVRMRRSGVLCGSITLGEIDTVNARASLGYWIGARHARRGLMSEALRLAIERAFTLHGLRTLEACVLPENEPSRRLLARMGFVQGGVAREHCRVQGRARDHERWVLRAPGGAALSDPSRAGSGSPG